MSLKSYTLDWQYTCPNKACGKTVNASNFVCRCGNASVRASTWSHERVGLACTSCGTDEYTMNGIDCPFCGTNCRAGFQFPKGKHPLDKVLAIWFAIVIALGMLHVYVNSPLGK